MVSVTYNIVLILMQKPVQWCRSSDQAILLLTVVLEISSQFLTKIATYFREKTAMLSFALKQLFLVKISCCSEADIALSSHNPTETSGKTGDKRR